MQNFGQVNEIADLQVVFLAGPSFLPVWKRKSCFRQRSETATGWRNLCRTSRHAQPCEESTKIKEAYGKIHGSRAQWVHVAKCRKFRL